MMIRSHAVPAVIFSLVACLVFSAQGGFAQDSAASSPARLTLPEIVERLTERNAERAVALAAAPPPLEVLERAAPAKGGKRGKADYRSNVNFDNRQIQGFNEANLQQLFQQEEKGVQVKKST